MGVYSNAIFGGDVIVVGLAVVKLYRMLLSFSIELADHEPSERNFCRSLQAVLHGKHLIYCQTVRCICQYYIVGASSFEPYFIKFTGIAQEFSPAAY